MAKLVPQPFQTPNNEVYDLRQLTLWDVRGGFQSLDPSRANFIEADVQASIPALEPVESPRGRLLSVGAAGLSVAELLSVILGAGYPAKQQSALNLAHAVIAKCQEVSDDFHLQLRHITVGELQSITGIGEAKAAAVIAAVELGKRLNQRRPQAGTFVDGPEVARDAFSADLMWETQERFGVLFLDVKHRIMSCQVIAIGSATEIIAHPREIFGEAVRRRAARIIVAHNHPSGSLEASPEDLQLTKQLLESGRILGMPVLDHLILTNGSYVSLRETTSLWAEFPQEGVGDGMMHEG